MIEHKIYSDVTVLNLASTAYKNLHEFFHNFLFTWCFNISGGIFELNSPSERNK